MKRKCCLLLVILLLGGILSGCGASQGETTSQQGSEEKDTLIIAIDEDLSALDPCPAIHKSSRSFSVSQQTLPAVSYNQACTSKK